MDAFFIPDGDRFLPTDHTRGPWSAEHQHGGPPSALLARAIEQVPTGGLPMLVTRMTVELLRAVPISPLTVRTEVLRPGKKVQLVGASLLSNDVELVRATALRIRTADVTFSFPPPPPPHPLPDAATPFVFPFFRERTGYHRAMEVRIARGTFGTGALTAWMRMLHPLLPDEKPTPLQRVMIAADSGNGLSVALDVSRYTFINPDLTVHLHRHPVGEWVCLDAVTLPEHHGVGLAQSALYDEQGPLGRSLQSLLLEARS
ncbi:MAG: thioesterase family protein [Myxococcota bacterium]